MKSVLMEYTAIGNHMLMGKAVEKHEAKKGRSNEDETWTLKAVGRKFLMNVII